MKTATQILQYLKANVVAMDLYIFLYIITAIYSSKAHEFDPMQTKIRNITDEVIHTNSRYIEPVIRHTLANTEVNIRVELRNVIEFDVSKGTPRLYAVFYWSWDAEHHPHRS